MPRTTKTITISLPPDMMGLVDYLARKEGRTKSELMREALRRYVDDREWRALIRYAQRRTKSKRVTEEQIEDIVDAFRR
ncbi:ribbon-helix-helix domain-containing protein [Thermofilum sp.]|uniref:ribbon-helix-helix domain-containing protein n=1 Tax=Thermofilum sp. TaxID=1961369 RepID=UPI0031780F3E